MTCETPRFCTLYSQNKFQNTFIDLTRGQNDAIKLLLMYIYIMCFPSSFNKPLSNHKKPFKVYIIKVFNLIRFFERTRQGQINIHHKLFYCVVSFRWFRFGHFVSVISFRWFRFEFFACSFRFEVSDFSSCQHVKITYLVKVTG